jgi:hypothetical protein
MSIKSTHLVTRDFAIEAIIKKQEDLNSLNNEDLANLLEETIHNGYYNFCIVSQQEIEDNKTREWPRKYLDDINDLPERDSESW